MLLKVFVTVCEEVNTEMSKNLEILNDVLTVNLYLLNLIIRKLGLVFYVFLFHISRNLFLVYFTKILFPVD